MTLKSKRPLTCQTTKGAVSKHLVAQCNVDQNNDNQYILVKQELCQISGVDKMTTNNQIFKNRTNYLHKSSRLGYYFPRQLVLRSPSLKIKRPRFYRF